MRKTLRSSSAPLLPASDGASLLKQIQQARSTVNPGISRPPGPDDKGRNMAERVISSATVAARVLILMRLQCLAVGDPTVRQPLLTGQQTIAPIRSCREALSATGPRGWFAPARFAHPPPWRRHLPSLDLIAASFASIAAILADVLRQSMCTKGGKVGRKPREAGGARAAPFHSPFWFVGVLDDAQRCLLLRVRMMSVPVSTKPGRSAGERCVLLRVGQREGHAD